MASPFFATHVLHMTIVVCSLRVGVDLRSCFETEQVSPWELLLVLSTAFRKRHGISPFFWSSRAFHCMCSSMQGTPPKVHMEPQTSPNWSYSEKHLPESIKNWAMLKSSTKKNGLHTSHWSAFNAAFLGFTELGRWGQCPWQEVQGASTIQYIRFVGKFPHIHQHQHLSHGFPMVFPMNLRPPWIAASHCRTPWSLRRTSTPWPPAPSKVWPMHGCRRCNWGSEWMNT